MLSSALLLFAIAVSTLLTTRHEALQLSSVEVANTTLRRGYNYNGTAVERHEALQLSSVEVANTTLRRGYNYNGTAVDEQSGSRAPWGDPLSDGLQLGSSEDGATDDGATDDGILDDDDSADTDDLGWPYNDDGGPAEGDGPIDELGIGQSGEWDSAEPPEAALKHTGSRPAHVVDMLNRSAHFNVSRHRSPACHPHFDLAAPSGGWARNGTKFKRIYFYHARKAGGSSVNKYLAKVADHYGVELKYTEWSEMEEPGTHDDAATFYVTHLREPVERAISHFKYQGRWPCRDLTRWGKSLRGKKKKKKRDKAGNDALWTPTADNANSIETWNRTGGHRDLQCHRHNDPETHRKRDYFFMGNCGCGEPSLHRDSCGIS